MRVIARVGLVCATRLPYIALFFVLTGIPSRAQQGGIGASIEGSVVDESGLPVAGANVAVKEMSLTQTRTASTDEKGRFRVASLPIGTYELTIRKPGFAAYRREGVVVSLGQTARLVVTLVPAEVSTQVTVSTPLPAVDPSQTSVISIIDKEFIEESPVRTRNALDFVLLAPGVAAPPPSSSAGAQAPLAASGFTLGGLRTRSNSISIDGFDNNDEWSGASRTELSPETVSEFQIVNNGISAQYGGASGGSVNVITRTGTNQMHGDAFLFAQNDVFNAKTPIENENEKPALSRFRAGVSNGGAIKADRTLYYWAFEQEHQRGQGDSSISPAVAAAVNNVMAARQLTINPGFYPIARAETAASAKIDHQITRNNSLAVRYAFLNNREAGDAFHSGGLMDPTTSGSSFIRDHTTAATLTSVLSPYTVNQLGFQSVSRNVLSRTNGTAGPEINIVGLVDFGRPYQGNDSRHEDHNEVNDVLSWSHGAHLVKTGAVVNHVSLDSYTPDGFGGVYIFPSLASFAAAQPDFFLQAFGDPRTGFGVTAYGGFLQDHVALTPRLTMDFGVRYDFEKLPAYFNQDTNNFSPRVGIAYNPASGWVLRAGFGIFFDRYVLANLNRALEWNGSRAFQQIANGAAAASLFQQNAGAPLGSASPLIRPSIYRADPHLADGYSEQASVGVEHQLAADLSLGLNYLYVRGVKLARTRNINLTSPLLLATENAVQFGVFDPSPQQLGGPYFGPTRLAPQFDNIYQIENSANSTYNGLTISLKRRMAQEIEFSASYALSKAIDDASDFGEQPQNPYDLHAERALSLNHQAQRFVASGLFELPFGDEDDANPDSLLSKLLSHIELAPIVTINSSRPVNPVTGLDSNGSGAFPLSARPLGFGRNTLWLPPTATVDFRIVKYFPVGKHSRLDLVADAFNLLNRTNITQINPWFGAGATALRAFAHPIEAASARQLQFSLDFEF
jgi:outer membrane receptor protein involved in Fe transport